jgi:hypothetical protein
MMNMDIDRIKRDLAADGYSVVRGVLSGEEVAEYLADMRAWQATVPNYKAIHRTVDPHGIHKYHYAGHTRAAWKIRLNMKLRRLFAGLWDVEDAENGLVVGFEGSCYIPPECTKEDSVWTHSDQSPSVEGVACYQAFAALTSNKKRTFVVYSGTHLEHRTYFESKGVLSTVPVPWQRCDSADIVSRFASRKRVVEVEAGDVVVWDSRTFHQNQYGAPPNVAGGEVGEERAVQYVCYMPKAGARNSRAMQAKRLAYYGERRTTTHWPYPIRVHPLQPPHRMIDYGSMEMPDLDDLDQKIRKLL